MRYVFGDYTLDVERYELRLDGQLVPVEPRVFDLLAYLVQHPGRTVLTEELLSQLYPHEFAPVERLTNAVAQARRVLHDTAQTQHYIQTVRRRGYRWCVLVTLQSPEGEPLPAPAALDILEAAPLAPIQGSAPAAPPAPPLDLLPLSPAVAAPADGPPPHAATFLAWHDPRVLCLSYAAWTLWVGYPDQALRRSQEAVAYAQQVGQAYTLALARAQGFVRWQGGGLILRGWAVAAQGAVDEGLAQIHEGLAAFQQTGERRLTKFQAVLAEAYGWGRQTDAALGVLAAALDLVHRQGERYYAAELYRLQGVLRGQHTPRHPGADAEERVQQALAIARHQGAKSLELRAAMSLTRLRQQQGKRAEACALLTPIYGWFTEGFDTADLQEAKALLEELGG